ncbi:MAG: TonB-dependent receptor plug domain-containing protein [Acidobacteriota bacterium]|nr:TonB-dependent receptor plug domain-containing protein [Acidobacteriota bacterium]
MLLLTLVLSLVWCGEASAQVRVEGTVRWADGSPAAGVTVAITDLNLKATTDEAGRYAFVDVKPGIRVAVDVSLGARVLGRAYSLVTRWVEQIDVSLAGTLSNPQPEPPPRPAVVAPAETSRAGASPSSGGTTDLVTYAADGTPTVSSEVTVTATLPMMSTSTEAGKVRLAPEQVTALPSLGTRDIFRALQLLPGVSSNETSSGLFVRGGTPDQNLVDYDGFTVYSVDHLFGYFSAFNMDAIDTVELSKGGYEARYGGRLSSLTEIRGNARPGKVRGTVGASLLSADGVLEVPLGSAASLLFAHRGRFRARCTTAFSALSIRNVRRPAERLAADRRAAGLRPVCGDLQLAAAIEFRRHEWPLRISSVEPRLVDSYCVRGKRRPRQLERSAIACISSRAAGRTRHYVGRRR